MTPPSRLRLSVVSVGIALPLSLALAACAPAEIMAPPVTLTVTPAENRIPVPSPPADPMPEVVWPLTGLDAGAATADELARPAFGIKVENTARGRPQKGIEYADIVFEEYINANCARLMAVYHSTLPEDVGPIRSARSMDPNIIGSFDTVLVASGSNFSVQNAFARAGQMFLADDFSGRTGLLQGSEGFHRMTRAEVDKDQEFRLWGRPATFVAEAAENGFVAPRQQFEFAYPADGATAAVEGTPVGNLDIRYSNCAHPHWVWDEGAGIWQRFEFEDAHLTMDGNQITAANVVVLRVKVAYTNGSNPESFVIVSDAPGYVASGGRITPIVWTKADRADTFHLYTVNGDPILLAPGQTWVELVPLSGAKTTAVISFDGVVQ